MSRLTAGNAQLIPDFFYVFEWPQDISDRRHNQFAKVAMREAIAKYHEKQVPRKFKRDARQRYGYKPRGKKYERYKQRKYGNGSIDMVKTGRTRRWMTSAYKLTVGGTASDRSLNATLKLTFPFKGGSGSLAASRFGKGRRANGARVIAQLISEMQRFANDEPALIVEWWRKSYMRQVDEFRATRKRVRTRK